MSTQTFPLTTGQMVSINKQIGAYYKAALEGATDRPKAVGISKPHEVNTLALHGVKTAKAAGEAHIYYEVLCVLTEAIEHGGEITPAALLRYMLFAASSGSAHGAVKITAYYEGVIEAQQTVARLID